MGMITAACFSINPIGKTGAIVINNKTSHSPSRQRYSPIKLIDPGVLIWASGNHLCQGINGVFIVNARKSPMKNFICVVVFIFMLYICQWCLVCGVFLIW